MAHFVRTVCQTAGDACSTLGVPFRLRKFAKRIMRLASVLRRIPGAERIADQIERSGPSIALNYAEAQAASSRAHFITIIETAEREARETQAALEIISDLGGGFGRGGLEVRCCTPSPSPPNPPPDIDQEYVKPSRLVSLYQESSEIVAILTTIARRAKENQYNGKHRKR